MISSTADGKKNGVGLLTEDRKETGLILSYDLIRNITITNLKKIKTGLVLDKKKERAAATELAEELGVKTPSMLQIAGNLSGGNQQKVVVSKWLSISPRILLLDEPTRNLSPLSGPVIRELLAEYPGCIITVSHDRRLIQEVCTRTVTLTPEGVRPSSFCDNF
mgnify:CR=1 FL=1